jgi:hypothetical protein
MQQVTAWFRYYNPLLQKPTALEPVMPWGFWWYYGPDPAAGCSYGEYESEQGHKIVCEKADKVFSPIDGKPMKCVGDVTLDDKSGVAIADITHSYQCKACSGVMISNLELLDEGHCVYCGAAIVYSNNKEKQTVDQALKEKVRANILKRRALASAASPEATTQDKSKVEAAAVQARREALAKRIKARLAERQAKAQTVQAEDEWVDLDEVLSKHSNVKAEELPASPDEAEAEKVAEKAADKVAEKVVEKVEEKNDEKDQKEEDFMSLDMVISALERKTRLEKVRASLAAKRKARAEAEVKAEKEKAEATAKLEATAKAEKAARVAAFKAKIKAKLKAKADAEKEEAKEEPKEEAKEAAKEAAPEEKPLEAAPACEPCDASPVLEAPVEAPVPANPDPVAPAAAAEKPMEVLEQASEAMKYEPLASAAALASVTREDLDMTLFGEGTENPTWNVSVKGIPLARVELQAQVSPDEIRSIFTTNDYALSLIDLCATGGVVETLQKVGATFWANHTSDRKVAASFKGAAEKAIAEAKAEMIKTFKDDYMFCLKTATAGINKNFYPSVGNPLKESLYTNMKTLGLPDASAKSAIEKAFAEASAEYFDSLFTKAEEYMKFSPEARTEIAEAISNSSAIDQSSDTHEPATLQSRVAQASIAPQLQFQSPIVVDTDSFKARLKQAWKPTR